MQNGYYAATGAMATQFNRLDLTSNNLANLNTNGFKRDDAITGDFLRLYQQYREQLPLEDQTKDEREVFKPQSQSCAYFIRNLYG